MFALAIEFLTGRYVATAYNDRRRHEWPPHPARIFSALVATHFEDPTTHPSERAALEWLEGQAPPEIHCGDADPRDPYDVFVPVNDTSIVDDLSGDVADVEAARQAVADEADPKEAAKARRQLDKLEAKLKTKTAKAIAPIVGAIPDAILAQGAALLPDRRGKQPRSFPSVTPWPPRMTLVWRGAEPQPEQRATLDALAARVVRIGHSSSLVAVRVLPDQEVTTTASRVPDPDGTEMLRGVESGQLARLCDDFVGHQGMVSGRTLPAAVHAYTSPRPARPSAPSGVFGDDWIVFAVASGDDDHLALPGIRAVDVARAFRKGLQSYAAQPPAEIISGHQPAGAPADRPHLAIVPLPFVGHRHADGGLRGVALVFPRAVGLDDRRAVLRAVHAWERSDRARLRGDRALLPLFDRGGLELWLVRETRPELGSLRPTAWNGPARKWATVTPIALDRHPGDLRARDPKDQAAAIEAAARSIEQACERQGLPLPRVSVVPAAPVMGAYKAQEFPAYPPIAGRTRRALTHAILEFERDVSGPLLLGAGRYHGLGLLRPVDGDSE